MPKVNIVKAASLSGHAGSIYILLSDPQAPNIFYSGSGDGKVIRWDLSDFSKGVVLAQVPSNIFSLLMIPQLDKMLVGQLQGGIHVLDLKEKKEVRHLAYHTQGVFDLQYDAAQNLVLAAGGDGVLSVWGVWGHELSFLKAVRISEKSIRQIAFHPGQNLIALGCSDHTAYILDSRSYVLAYSLRQHESSVFSVCFSPDGKLLLTGSRDARLRIWDVQNDFHLLTEIPAHLFTLNCIVFSPDGNYVATASRDKTIKIWDARNFELLKVVDKEKLDGHVNSVNKLIWSSYENLLVSCSDDRSIMVWKLLH